jgi:hypothetical protein
MAFHEKTFITLIFKIIFLKPKQQTYYANSFFEK